MTQNLNELRGQNNSIRISIEMCEQEIEIDGEDFRNIKTQIETELETLQKKLDQLTQDMEGKIKHLQEQDALEQKEFDEKKKLL